MDPDLGALNGGGGGGVPMSPVNFKKWQCRMSLSLIYAHVACRIKEMTMSLSISMSPVACHYG